MAAIKNMIDKFSSCGITTDNTGIGGNGGISDNGSGIIEPGPIDGGGGDIETCLFDDAEDGDFEEYEDDEE
jgi:hypothetical protein